MRIWFGPQHAHKSGVCVGTHLYPSTEWWLAMRIARAHWPASLVKAASSHFSKRDPASKMRQKVVEKQKAASSIQLWLLGVHTADTWILDINHCICMKEKCTVTFKAYMKCVVVESHIHTLHVSVTVSGYWTGSFSMILQFFSFGLVYAKLALMLIHCLSDAVFTRMQRVFFFFFLRKLNAGMMYSCFPVDNVSYWFVRWKRIAVTTCALDCSLRRYIWIIRSALYVFLSLCVCLCVHFSKSSL